MIRVVTEARCLAEPIDSRCFATNSSGFILSEADDNGAGKENIARTMNGRNITEGFLFGRYWRLLIWISVTEFISERGPMPASYQSDERSTRLKSTLPA